MTTPEFEALKRQRESVAAHLRWIDDLIQSEGVSQTVGQIPKEPALAVASTPLPQATTASLEIPQVPEEVDVSCVHSEVRRGCFIYAAIALAAVFGVVAYIYMAY